jgi:hypothetical protein
MVTLHVNPGSGPVQSSTEENAWVNIRSFVDDLGAKGVAVVNILRRSDADRREGRYEFDLFLRDPQPQEESAPRSKISVSMPGRPLDRVRYLKLPEQDIWQFPRLYIDGSSWVWFFAIEVCVQDKKPDTP